ncbi:MAG: DUF427 domain-containing protein [Rhodothermaceae bacterium]|nr:DUF427 domain-containing protein [Rhodothermaceae bacterium]
MWKYTGIQRPPFATEPQEGQESVWDYPRPPALVKDSRLIEVKHGDVLIATTTNAYRVLETASPPTVYIPPQDVHMDRLIEMRGSSFCEWKGAASYWGLSDHPEEGAIGWSYKNPSRSFSTIKDYMSFYPGRLACYINQERVRPQPGGFYGGWVTNEIVGPYKGEAGTGGW